MLTVQNENKGGIFQCDIFASMAAFFHDIDCVMGVKQKCNTISTEEAVRGHNSTIVCYR